MSTVRTVRIFPQRFYPAVLAGTVAIVGYIGLSLVWSVPRGAAEPYCQVQLGDKIATVPCSTCENLLAEPGMAGNVDCPSPGVPQRRPAAESSVPSNSDRLTPAEQNYINDLKALGIRPTSSLKNLAQTGPAICQNLMEAYRQNGSALAGPGIKNGGASAMRRSNPNLSWDGAQGWVQSAVNNFCPDRLTGMHLQ